MRFSYAATCTASCPSSTLRKSFAMRTTFLPCRVSTFSFQAQRQGKLRRSAVAFERMVAFQFFEDLSSAPADRPVSLPSAAYVIHSYRSSFSLLWRCFSLSSSLALSLSLYLSPSLCLSPSLFLCFRTLLSSTSSPLLPGSFGVGTRELRLCSVQFQHCVSLISWLMRTAGRSLNVDQFDDPNSR